MASREHDEQVLLALTLLSEGWRLATVAEVLGWHPWNLWKTAMKVYHADIACEGKSVTAHYPIWFRNHREKK